MGPDLSRVSERRKVTPEPQLEAKYWRRRLAAGARYARYICVPASRGAHTGLGRTR